MDYSEFFENMKESADNEKSIKMSAYMRDLFQFLGIPTPIRKKLCRDIFKEAKKKQTIDWNFIELCWKNPYREFQYVGVDYLILMEKYLVASDISKLKELAIDKSWWDTIDGLDGVIGYITKTYPQLNEILIEWSVSDNFWLRRIAIDHQLSRKEQTNTELLETIIINNLGQSEFFINKAIGWSLREYSKVNPKWVSNFIETYRERLAPLSIREAGKYIK